MTKTRTRLSVLAAFPLLFVLATGAGAQGLADEATGSSGPPAWGLGQADRVRPGQNGLIRSWAIE